MSSEIRRDPSLVVQPVRWRAVGAAPGQPYAASPPNSEGTRIESKAHHIEAETEQKIQAAYAQGRQEGETALRQQMAAQVDSFTSRLARSIEEITGLRQRIRHEAEEEVIALAIAIARRVIHREMTVAPEALLGLVKAALEKVDARELHRVRIHPEGAPALREHLENIGLPRRVEIVADPGLERGGVILEMSRGTLDASVETQLAEIERGFADLVRRAP